MKNLKIVEKQKILKWVFNFKRFNFIQQNSHKIKKFQRQYNRTGLKQLVDLPLFLSTNGLPFQGYRENIYEGKQNKELF